MRQKQEELWLLCWASSCESYQECGLVQAAEGQSSLELLGTGTSLFMPTAWEMRHGDRKQAQSMAGSPRGTLKAGVRPGVPVLPVSMQVCAMMARPGPWSEASRALSSLDREGCPLRAIAVLRGNRSRKEASTPTLPSQLTGPPLPEGVLLPNSLDDLCLGRGV